MNYNNLFEWHDAIKTRQKYGITLKYHEPGVSTVLVSNKNRLQLSLDIRIGDSLETKDSVCIVNWYLQGHFMSNWLNLFTH